MGVALDPNNGVGVAAPPAVLTTGLVNAVVAVDVEALNAGAVPIEAVGAGVALNVVVVVGEAPNADRCQLSGRNKCGSALGEILRHVQRRRQFLR
jgi:hypothetical protein